MKTKRERNLDNLSKLENNIAKLYRTNIIQPLKGFCRVVEEGNLSRAAEKYGITPGLLTKQIKVIENQLGVKLFNRDNSCRIFPNETGLNFYEKVSNIINQLENVILDFSKQENDKESKILRIGVSSFTLTKLIPLLPAFEDANKNITLNINVYEHSNALDLLEENKLDIFISSKENYEEINPKIEFIKIMNYIPYWVLWKGHPLENKKELTKDDLINSKIVFDDHNSTSKSFKDFCEDCKIKSTLDIKNFSLEAQKLLIKNEIGIGPIFDVFLNKDDCADFVFKNATNLFPAGEYGFYTKKIRKVIANKFIEYFSKCIKDNFSFVYKE